MRHQSGIERARSALETGNRLPADTLSNQVAQSWERCRSIGLDPLGQPNKLVHESSEVGHRREVNASLRRLALAEMQTLYSQIAGSNFMIAYADSNAVVLDTISDHSFANSLAGRTIIPGSAWDEATCGTNGLGVVAREGQPAAIYGREHYFASHGQLSCMTAPICDSSGRVLGMLDASCSYEARQQHTHALVRMAATQIENGLIYQDAEGDFIFAFHPRIEYLDTLSAGLMAVSRDGDIYALNRSGTALLVGLPARMGSNFNSLFDAEFGTAMDGMMRGGIIRISDKAGSGVFMVCRQIGFSARRVFTQAKPTLIRNTQKPDFVCDEPAIQRQLDEAANAVNLAMPVHIHGETGTGKELVARHLHKLTGRTGEFVAVNCGAIPDSLFIAELFGYVRGAFTDAHGDGSPGLVRSANQGTLFLDEVADIPLVSQTTLLRFLDTMEIRSVGGQKVDKVNVQIVSATNADLEAMAVERNFRSDLLYRLNAYTIKLPSLAQRTDFAAIIHGLIDQLAPGTAITDAAIARLSTRPWPGNIRELRSVLQRALVRCNSGYIDEDCFDDIVDDSSDDCCAICRTNPLNRGRCREIRSTYRVNGHNVSRTARELQISRTTVYKHVRE